MKIEYNSKKRNITLIERGLDMAHADQIFSGDTLTVEDDRQDYGEVRYITIGFLFGRMVMVAWTQRKDARRIISMRKANDREKEKYSPRFT